MSRLHDLRRARPRSRLVEATAWMFAGLALYSWLAGDVRPGELFRATRWSNVRRFVLDEARPRPLREGGGLAETWDWLGEILVDRGFGAALSTLAISVLAIALAGLAGAVVAPLVARTLADDDPYLGEVRRIRGWRRLRTLAFRLACVLARAVPEYALAFLLLAIFGPTAWPAVLALAIHNAGILGRLGGEVVENVESRPLRALRALGASRTQITGVALVPLALGRYLLFFFYRFESCVRESTVLGMLGIASLGYWIQDARARQDYDEMLVFLVLGAAIVAFGEVLSYVAREAVRRA